MLFAAEETRMKRGCQKGLAAPKLSRSADAPPASAPRGRQRGRIRTPPPERGGVADQPQQRQSTDVVEWPGRRPVCQRAAAGASHTAALQPGRTLPP